jgi:hypothetical protein
MWPHVPLLCVRCFRAPLIYLFPLPLDRYSQVRRIVALCKCACRLINCPALGFASGISMENPVALVPAGSELVVLRAIKLLPPSTSHQLIYVFRHFAPGSHLCPLALDSLTYSVRAKFHHTISSNIYSDLRSPHPARDSCRNGKI